MCEYSLVKPAYIELSPVPLKLTILSKIPSNIKVICWVLQIDSKRDLLHTFLPSEGNSHVPNL